MFNYEVEAHEKRAGLERAPMIIRVCAASLETLRERSMWPELALSDSEWSNLHITLNLTESGRA